MITGLALKCATCSGSLCNGPWIPEIECNRRIPNAILSEKDIFGDSEYGCLDLEYEVEGVLFTFGLPLFSQPNFL